MSTTSRRIEAVETTCEIIELLRESGSLGVTEVSEELNRSKSSVHAYLMTLVDQKYVVKNGDSYRLSLKYLDLAEHVKKQVGKYSVIRSEIDKLADDTGEVAQFATIEHGDLVYIYKSGGIDSVDTMSSIGSRETLHSTALGKSILSQMDKDTVRDNLGNEPFLQKTENTITSYDDMFDELDEIEDRGYAVDHEENTLGLKCIAAPIILDSGEILGAISVSGPTSRMKQSRIQDSLQESVLHSANIIQVNTKFSQDQP